MPRRLVLASRSPRRQALLAQIGMAFEVLPADIPEQRHPDETPMQYVSRVARAKAEAVLARFDEGDGVWVLGADTEVVADDEVFGKPGDAAEAAAMLGRLAGRTHEVVSCVWLLDGTHAWSAGCCSRVTLDTLDARAIERYVASGEPFGKAGAYAIQGRAAAFVAHLEGSYSAVMGLPLYQTAGLLQRAGLA